MRQEKYYFSRPKFLAIIYLASKKIKNIKAKVYKNTINNEIKRKRNIIIHNNYKKKRNHKEHSRNFDKKKSWLLQYNVKYINWEKVKRGQQMDSCFYQFIVK